MKAIISIEIEKTANELTQLISSTNEEQFNKIPFEGSWSIAQVGDHLLKSYGAVEILNGPVTKTGRSPGEKIEMIKETFLNFDKKYQSDKSILPKNRLVDKEILLSELKNRIAQIQEVIRTKDLSETCAGFALPAFGEFTRLEWLSLILYHTQRHIHQIKNILKPLEKKSK
ncbi:MAG: DinB family protein [Bacteroidota bacterium]|nr:DinB family protein [Bacteroidota bacterium]